MRRTVTTREYDDEGRVTRETTDEFEVADPITASASRCSLCGSYFSGLHACWTVPTFQNIPAPVYPTWTTLDNQTSVGGN